MSSENLLNVQDHVGFCLRGQVKRRIALEKIWWFWCKEAALQSQAGMIQEKQILCISS